MNHEHFMGAALDLARKTGAEGNLPCGALLVRDGKIIAGGANTVSADVDPTAHAEVMAIRTAAKKLGTIDLAGSTLYTTMEPCPMCCWAILLAKIDRLVVGARHDPALRPDLGGYNVDVMLKLTGKPLELVTGVRQHECEEPFRAWVANHSLQGTRSR